MIQNLSRTPTESYFNEHYFCDYIELLAVTSNGSPISKSDIFDRFCEDNRVTSSGEEGSYEINDNWNSKLINWFSMLEIRKNTYGDFYPFDVSNTSVSLNIKLLETIRNKHKIYIFLLLNSLQKYIDNPSCSILTSDFEEFSLKAFKKYIPSSAEIHRFGKSGLDFNRYTGHITNKIDKFAEDIKCPILYEERFFSNNNNGDGGLDLVSWIPFLNDSNYNNIQIFLAQCATGKNWLEKKDDTDKFHNYISFRGAVQNIMFIPYDGRNNDRTFNEEAQMNKHLFLDRDRLLNLIAEDIEELLTLNSFAQIVEPAIDFEEDII